MIAMASYPGDPRIRRQAEALEKAGFEVDVLCRYSGRQPPKQKFGNVTAYRIMNAPPRENRIIYFLQSVLFLIVAFFRLLPLSIKRKYKVIQVHNLPDYLIFVGIFHKIFGVKLILDIHDPSVDLFEEKWPGKKNKIFKYLVKISERYSCKLSDHLITVTSMCKEKLVERGNPANKITLILNTPNETIFTFNKLRNFTKITKGVKILYYGTIAERQGLHNAVKAMQYLLKDIPNSSLNIYGIYVANYRKKLENLNEELNLENNVFLHGKIIREKILDIINEHDIGIVPHPCTQYLNLSLPTKAFEYVTSGLPVVSTRIESLFKTLNDNCITYVENGNPKDLSEAIKYICLNPEVRKSRTDLAYQAIKEISGDVMNKRYIDLIDKMIIS
jgi:glycosyltransferase involved in cell wall biosynthesis